MQRLRTVVLHHRGRSGSHYDLLFEPPGSAARRGRLVCFRLSVAPGAWAATPRSILLERLEDHRRRYLTYQGAIGGGRGSVRRVDAGWANVVAWSDASAELALTLGRFAGRLTLRRLGAGRWLGQVAPSPRRPASFTMERHLGQSTSRP